MIYEDDQYPEDMRGIYLSLAVGAGVIIACIIILIVILT